MDFISVTFFLILSYLRPQEWITAIKLLQPVKVCVAMAVISMLLRHRGFTMRDFFRTPHDWWIGAFIVWVIVAAPNSFDTFGMVYGFFLFYVVTVQALASIRRCQSFLNWWTLMVFAIAVFALLGEYQIYDPLGSFDRTHGAFKDRLMLNLSIFANPNALGHAVYPGLLLVYFTLFWKRPVFVKIASLPLFAILALCIYLTMSKGAFVCGFVTMVAALAFGRPKTVQIGIVLLALTLGWGAVKALPRMEELDKAKSDQAIQGRVAASQFGMRVMKSSLTGLGYGQFQKAFFQSHGYVKAPHGSYVQYAAETGLVGLFLFCGTVYCCMRTLYLVKTRSPQEERVRRILFALLCAYLVSSWMVDFGFRATFFLMVATIAAFHRAMLSPSVEEEVEDQPAIEPAFVTAGRPELAAAATVSPSLVMHSALTPQHPMMAITSDEPESPPEKTGIAWNKTRLLDLALIVAVTYFMIRFWEVILTRI